MQGFSPDSQKKKSVILRVGVVGHSCDEGQPTQLEREGSGLVILRGAVPTRSQPRQRRTGGQPTLPTLELCYYLRWGCCDQKRKVAIRSAGLVGLGA